MTSISAAGFPARSGADRNAFLVFVGLVWVGVLSGFGTDSFDHVRKHGLDYPLIVHFHALVFVSWLVFFTVQTALIRSRRADLHRRLGVFGAVWACIMVVLGPATAIVSDARAYASHGTTPEFLAVQFTDMLAFAALTGSALLLRRHPLAHKRLMLIGLFYISDAGFARFLNPMIAAPLGASILGEMAYLYLGSDLLLLCFGAYDFVIRRKLHPAYLAGAAVMLMLQLTALILLHSPGWKAITLHIIGH